MELTRINGSTHVDAYPDIHNANMEAIENEFGVQSSKITNINDTLPKEATAEELVEAITAMTTAITNLTIIIRNLPTGDTAEALCTEMVRKTDLLGKILNKELFQ